MKKVLFSLMLLLVCGSIFANDTIGYYYNDKKCPIERWNDEWNSKTATYIQTNIYDCKKEDGYYYSKAYLVVEDSVMSEFIQYLKDLDRDWMAVYDSLYTHPDEHFPEYIHLKGKLNTTARFDKAKCWWFENTPNQTDTYTSNFFTINKPSIAIKWNRDRGNSNDIYKYGTLIITQSITEKKNDKISTVSMIITLKHKHLLDLISILESIKF